LLFFLLRFLVSIDAVLYILILYFIFDLLQSFYKLKLYQKLKNNYHYTLIYNIINISI